MLLDDIEPILREDFVDYDDWKVQLMAGKAKLKLYAKECSEALDMMSPLYHGRVDHTNDAFAVKFIRDNRRSMDTHEWFSNVFHRLIEMKFGSLVVSRSSSVFMSPDPEVAQTFGDLYFALPPNDTNYLLYSGSSDTKELSVSMRLVANKFLGKNPFVPFTEKDGADIMNNRELLDHLFETYKNTLQFFPTTGSLAAYLATKPVGEIMASGTEAIPLVKIPEGVHYTESWKRLQNICLSLR